MKTKSAKENKLDEKPIEDKKNGGPHRPFISDVEELRKPARKHMEMGPSPSATRLIGRR